MTAKSLVRDELKGVTWHSYVRLIRSKTSDTRTAWDKGHHDTECQSYINQK